MSGTPGGIDAHESGFCRYCSDIVPIICQEGHTTRPFHPTLAELYRHCDSCQICRYLGEYFEQSDFGGPYDEAKLYVRLKEPHASEAGVRWAVLEVAVQTSSLQEDFNTSHTFSVTTCPLDTKREQDPLLDSSSLTGPKISKIKKWLRNCESNHGSCCRPSRGEVPKRLILVGTSGNSSRLVLGVDVPEPTLKYTTLSHCWGDRLPLRTTISNLENFSDEIPSDEIPRTFQDAIQITRALGVQYLWIDALCIVQDSPEEWGQEAVKMKDVYAGSCLNIAASDSPNSEGGCFRLGNQAYSFKLTDMNGTISLVRLQRNDTRIMTGNTSISSRGWVLQEQLLSHRMISCMDNEMHWECSETYESDTGAQFRHAASATRGIPRLYQLEERTSSDAWRIWMEDFSQRKFTFWKDRLPALSGLLQFYQDINNDTPLLGLWKQSLIKDLLWIRLGDIPAGRVRDDIDQTKLPSWSWLSCPAEIAFDIWQLTLTTTRKEKYVTDRADALLVDHSIKWTATPFVTPIESAYIVLEGVAIDVSIDLEKDVRESTPPALRLSMSNGQCLQCTGQFDKGDVQPGRYTCLLLHSRSHTQTAAQRLTFLILSQITTSPGYLRVGIGCVTEKTLFEAASKGRYCIG